VLRLARLKSAVSAPIRFCIDAGYRSAVLLRFSRPAELHQSTVLTRMDRYPQIFATCRAHFAEAPGLRILSYGCATGEEVLTLRRYFPSATIVGAEINARCLAVARKHVIDDRIAFIESDSAAIRSRAPFDAIFCMAVLQRTPMLVAERGIQNLKEIYPFEKFDAKVTELDSWLKPGGLLVIHYSQYALSRATVGPRYEPLITALHLVDNDPKFDRDSQRCGDVPNSVFVKL
jgi:SAM-dependent methyltransferase